MTRANQGQRIQVPDELREVLLEFTISYLLEQPNDLISYAAEYFARLLEARQNMQIEAEVTGDMTPDPMMPDISVYNIVTDPPPPAQFGTRRKSVFAEAYDPENDTEDEGPPVIYPKTDEERGELIENVKNILLFRSLDADQMNCVLDAMFERKVIAGELVIKEGDDGDNFYVIRDGVYHAFVSEHGQDPKLIHTYDNRGSFGELALLYNMPRAATIKATTDGKLWAMDRGTFRRILLKSAYKKRKMYEEFINSVPMLKTLQPYERMNLADALVPRQYPQGTQIISQGEVADGMYFVEDGVIRIMMREEDGEEVLINRVGQRGYFGELALVTNRPRAASAYAEEDVKLAFLDVEAFERLLGPCMQLMKRNIQDYEEQILKIFGSHSNLKDLR